MLILLILLVALLASLFQTAGQRAANVNGYKPKPSPAPAPAERDDFFRLLPAEAGNDRFDAREERDDGFTLLANDNIGQVNPQPCFTCGRPKNKGDHQHWTT
jgi:hypothetical protein